MLPETFLHVLQHEGVVAIASQAGNGTPHLVNTWNSYVLVSGDERLLIPAGGMHRTEQNISENRAVLLTLGSREVQGKRGSGAGFLISGTAQFLYTGTEFETIRSRFPWARAALVVSIKNIAQTL